MLDIQKEDHHDHQNVQEHIKLEKKINLLALTGIFGTGTVIAAEKIPSVSKLLLAILGPG